LVFELVFGPTAAAVAEAAGNATRKAGADPFATPVGDTGFGAFELRFWSVLLEAMCSREMVPGSERRTSKEWVAEEAEEEVLVLVLVFVLVVLVECVCVWGLCEVRCLVREVWL
jgi:hypothetical protein